jgi:hypothetical protein
LLTGADQETSTDVPVIVVETFLGELGLLAAIVSRKDFVLIAYRLVFVGVKVTVIDELPASPSDKVAPPVTALTVPTEVSELL